MKQTILLRSFFCALILLAPALLRAQGSSADDGQWNLGVGPFNVNGVVYTTAKAPNGDLYIGGAFTVVGTVPAVGIARWDGTAWHALGNGILGGPVYAIAFRGNEVIVGGDFGGAGTVQASNIARWTGTAWESFGDVTREGLDSTVTCIVVHNNTIYAAGYFTYSGNQDIMNNIAYWSDQETMFLSLDDGTRRGTDAPIYAMTFAQDSLYIAGAFAKAGGTSAARIARWNGTAWSNLSNGVSLQGGNPVINAIAVYDSTLYVGGSFTFAGGKPIKNIARWILTSKTWLNAGSGGLDSAVNALAVNDSGWVYAGGNFMNGGTTPVARVAKWKPGAGSSWAPLGAGIDGVVHTLLIDDSSNVWAGGSFMMAGTSHSPNLARWTEVTTPVSGVDADAANSTALSARVVPNPASGICAVNVTLPSAGIATLTIVNTRGEAVATMSSGMLETGTHAVQFDTRSIPNGMYFCRVASGTQVATTSFVVAR